MAGRVVQGSFLGGRPVIQARTIGHGHAANAPAPLSPNAAGFKNAPPVQAKRVGPTAPAPLSANAAPLRPPAPPRPTAPTVQAKRPAAARHPNAMALPDDVLARAPTAQGRPLPDDVRAHMEGLLKADLRAVRVFESRAPAAIGAIAFTAGNEVHIAQGKYAPHTPEGRRLLGHELAHVVQQRAGRVTNPFGAGTALVTNPALEAEADRVGLRAMMAPPETSGGPVSGRPGTIQPKRPGVVQPMEYLEGAWALASAHPYVAGAIGVLGVTAAVGSYVLGRRSPEPVRAPRRRRKKKKKKSGGGSPSTSTVRRRTVEVDTKSETSSSSTDEVPVVDVRTMPQSELDRLERADKALIRQVGGNKYLLLTREDEYYAAQEREEERARRAKAAEQRRRRDAEARRRRAAREEEEHRATVAARLAAHIRKSHGYGSDIVCVMADRYGGIVSTGHSSHGVSASTIRDEYPLLRSRGTLTHAPESDRYGAGCAEYDCLHRLSGGGRARAVYTLSYDRRARRFIPTCANCSTNMPILGIVDLYPYL